MKIILKEDMCRWNIYISVNKESKDVNSTPGSVRETNKINGFLLTTTTKSLICLNLMKNIFSQ